MSSDHPRREKPALRPPPDYFSRRVKLRLFTLVAMVMLVLWLMFEARKPETWQWMWGGRPPHAGGPLTEAELAGGDEDVDTRLQSSPRAASPPGVITAESSSPSLLEEGDADSEDERLVRARRDGWLRVLDGMATDENERLHKMLKVVRDEQPPDEDTLQHWPAVVEQLGRRWDQYLREAFQYLIDSGDQLSESQRAAWHAAVQKLELEWKQTLEPALKAAGDADPLLPDQRQALAGLQTTLDTVALSQVRDDSIFRSAERHAWFRFLEQLDQQKLEDIQKTSKGRVGFIQLFKQPEAYRGQLVAVRGTAQLGYRVQAPKNVYGIDEYYVYWLRPAGGPDSPIAVYALEAPPGFPRMKDKDRDRGTTPLDEEVEFTGYFFKRWAYRAHDGLRVAPLILAKAPRWTPRPEPVQRFDPSDPWTLAMCLLAAAAVGAVIVLGSYWQGQWRSAKDRVYSASAERFAERLKGLEENDPAVDVREVLRHLSEQETRNS